jgi:hypothetical protein
MLLWKSVRCRLVATSLASCVLAAALLGCNRADNRRYIPAAAPAREALTVALQTWAAGGETPRLTAGKPGLQFADSLRAGRKLERFEIIGELPVEEGRRFEVQLTLSDPPGREKAQYIVIGIDPLWVIRMEDYHMVTHWDHPMPKEGAPAQSIVEAQSTDVTSDE